MLKMYPIIIFCILAANGLMFAEAQSLIDTNQQATAQQDMKNLYVATVALNNSVSASVLQLQSFSALVSDVLAKSCSDNYAGAIGNALLPFAEGRSEKLEDILNLLQKMTAPPDLEATVQDTLNEYADIENKLRRNNTNQDLQIIINQLTEINAGIGNDMVPKLMKYINQNSSGILGLPINTPFQCICLSKFIARLKGCNTGGNILSDIVDPSSNPNNDQYYQLGTALDAANLTCSSISNILNLFPDLLTALNVSRCSSDYNTFLVSAMKSQLKSISLKLVPILNLTQQLNMTDISKDLQDELTELTSINAILSNPNESTNDTGAAFNRLSVLLQKVLGQTLPEIQQQIKSNQNLASGCVCMNQVSLLLFKFLTPLLSGPIGKIVNPLLIFLLNLVNRLLQ